MIKQKDLVEFRKLLDRHAYMMKNRKGQIEDLIEYDYEPALKSYYKGLVAAYDIAGVQGKYLIEQFTKLVPITAEDLASYPTIEVP